MHALDKLANIARLLAKTAAHPHPQNIPILTIMPPQFERPEALNLSHEMIPADSEGNLTDRGSTERAREAQDRSIFPKKADESIEIAEEKRQEILAEIRSELSVLADPDRDLLGDISPENLKDFKDEVYATGEEWINRLNENPDENIKGFREDLEDGTTIATKQVNIFPGDQEHPGAAILGPNGTIYIAGTKFTPNVGNAGAWLAKLALP